MKGKEVRGRRVHFDEERGTEWELKGERRETKWKTREIENLEKLRQ